MLTVPGLCWLCRMPLALAHWGICSSCARTLPLRISVCPCCALPALDPTLPCGRCLQKMPPWQHMVAVSSYTPPLSHLVHQMKFSRRPELALALARLLYLAVRNEQRRRSIPAPDLLVNVPLWHRRQWRRGYNQSDLLCRKLVHWVGCRYEPAALRRIKRTRIQHQLSARLRKRNLKNAFRLELPVQGLHMVIVDDVVTTGSTVAELSKLLLRHGAATVQVWCLCRTL
ncbi:DNA utilization protein GntX [Yokenella regensburgei]|uniref:DNA utilization protein GntX n=1 Tax=Yokenella regensburgei TaxID=158877 RepID=UPI003F14F132